MKQYSKASDCPITNYVQVIGGKWKPIIIWVVLEEKKRFGELRKLIPGISIKMLSRHLKELEKDGILLRTAYPEVPPRVEYSLTEKGRSLAPIIRSMADWSNQHLT